MSTDKKRKPYDSSRHLNPTTTLRLAEDERAFLASRRKLRPVSEQIRELIQDAMRRAGVKPAHPLT